MQYWCHDDHGVVVVVVALDPTLLLVMMLVFNEFGNVDGIISTCARLETPTAPRNCRSASEIVIATSRTDIHQPNPTTTNQPTNEATKEMKSHVPSSFIKYLSTIPYHYQRERECVCVWSRYCWWHLLLVAHVPTPHPMSQPQSHLQH
jgi:hypothetical protein